MRIANVDTWSEIDAHQPAMEYAVDVGLFVIRLYVVSRWLLLHSTGNKLSHVIIDQIK